MSQNNQLITKVSNMKVPQIYFLYHLIRYVLSCIILITLFFFFRQTFANGYSAMTLALTIFLWLIVLIIIAHHYFFISVVDNILYNQIHLEKYVDYYSYAYKKASRSAKKRQTGIVEFSKGLVAFYKGDFRSAIIHFDNCDATFIPIPDREKYVVNTLLYKELCRIHLNQFSGGDKQNPFHQFATRNKKTLSRINDYENMLEAIKAVKNEEKVSYFDQMQASNPLTAVMKNYYQAVSYQNGGDDHKTCQIFEDLSTENPELFYVQEAQKYLAELTND